MQVGPDHKLNSVTWRPSPHFSTRPNWAVPELIVVHCISLPENEFGTDAPARLFLGQLDPGEHPSFADLADVEVSSHVIIHRQGEVHQFVAFDQQAWHAGLSNWCGRSSCNAYSIGIELEGSVSQGYTGEQIDALVVCIKALLEKYPSLSVGNIVGHADIAPGRKYDPGPHFDWVTLMNRLHAKC